MSRVINLPRFKKPPRGILPARLLVAILLSFYRGFRLERDRFVAPSWWWLRLDAQRRGAQGTSAGSGGCIPRAVSSSSGRQSSDGGTRSDGQDILVGVRECGAGDETEEDVDDEEHVGGAFIGITSSSWKRSTGGNAAESSCRFGRNVGAAVVGFFAAGSLLFVCFSGCSGCEHYLLRIRIKREKGGVRLAELEKLGD
ncbi:hypothetical protein MRX96_013154 [Rhipicephalus microplus]